MEIREHYYHSLDSTNNEAKKQAENHCPEGTVISAGRQTAGRGRRGHDWETPQDEAIATSMVLYPCVPLERLPGLTLFGGGGGAQGSQRSLWPGGTDQVAE